jgi:nitroimidazol reductase NimA-like FMN-containing flavoprotein (pyridoxamine 5'-phosphate oxidase superfamily)
MTTVIGFLIVISYFRSMMIGNLNDNQIDEMLKKHFVGRIGCHNGNDIYVVPVSYAYDGKYIYVRSVEGKKIEMLRKNPSACFEVDETQDMAHWQSVIIKGKYEELTDETERNKALKILIDRRLPIMSSTTTHLGDIWPFPPEDLSIIKGVVFRISVEEKTGRYEGNGVSPAITG